MDGCRVLAVAGREQARAPTRIRILPPRQPHCWTTLRRQCVHHRDRPSQGHPHRRGSRREQSVIDELRLVADQHQRDRLLSFARRYEPRTWAIEGAGGLGALLAQQVVGAGESVLDGPLNSGRRSSLSARRCTAPSTSTGTRASGAMSTPCPPRPGMERSDHHEGPVRHDAQHCPSCCLSDRDEAVARSSGDVDAEPPPARRPTAPCGRRSAR